MHSASSDVLIRKEKLDGTVKYEWQGQSLPSQNPDWIVVLHDPNRHRKSRDGESLEATGILVHCLNTRRPITVLFAFNVEGSLIEAKCDAALPAERRGGTVAFVDLDLDLIVDSDRSCYVRDQAVFEQNTEGMEYGAEVVQSAYEGIELAQDLVRKERIGRINGVLPSCARAAGSGSGAGRVGAFGRVWQRFCQGLCVGFSGNAATGKVLRPVVGFARVIELHFGTGGDTASLDALKALRLGVAGSVGVIEFGLREGAWRRDGRTP